ncbi:MAG: DUF4173 domain-containing protein [Bacteroidales bacterium]|nr:DUF4173 domain-containing protein [Bacteroidales bacterium]
MKRREFIALTLILASVFSLLFYRNSLGINLIIFEWIIIPTMFYTHKPVRLNPLSKTILLLLIISSLMVVVINTPWTIFMNFVLMFSFSTLLVFKEFRSYIHSFIETIIRLFTTHFSSQNYINTNKEKLKLTNVFSKILLFGIIPFSILFLFLILYLSASSKFANTLQPFFSIFSNWFDNTNTTLFWVFVLGVIIINILLRKSKSIGLLTIDNKSQDKLERKRLRHIMSFSTMGLKTQNIMGIITLIALNLLLLLFNIIDIKTVWFFKWDGEFLKEFVHQGTWILIFAILFSALISLFLFKDNLNFYSKNKHIKQLTLIWLSQNIVLALSVIIRNYWYMTYFGLAYKRIAVLFFLLLAIFGLITIIIKITKSKTSFYLLRINSMVAIIIISISSFIDWNIIIAKYNFANYDKSFIEYRFMAKLEDSSLPYTIKTENELKIIDSLQNKALPSIKNHPYYWSKETYFEEIELKKQNFINKYKSQNLLEWNLSDYITYRKLTNK